MSTDSVDASEGPGRAAAASDVPTPEQTPVAPDPPVNQDAAGDAADDLVATAATAGAHVPAASNGDASGNGASGNGASGNGAATAAAGPRPSGGMRGMIEGLESPHPLGHTLPGVLQDDEFAQRFVSGLDGVLAPVFSTLDNIDAYLDPQLTPADFLPWLAGWHGAEVDAGWPEERSRNLMSRLPELQGGRGTVAALREILLLHTGSEPEIIDSGGAAWSAVPGGDLPGTDTRELTVRVKGQNIDRARIEALVREATPAHIVVHVEVVD